MAYTHELDGNTQLNRDEAWALTRDDDERYIAEGVGRRMAEALWSDFLQRYPGVSTRGLWMDGRPLELSEAAARLFRGAQHEESWVVGETRRIIREAKICAEIAERALASAGENMEITRDSSVAE